MQLYSPPPPQNGSFTLRHNAMRSVATIMPHVFIVAVCILVVLLVFVQKNAVFVHCSGVFCSQQ